MSKKINIRPTTSVYATYKNINYKIWNAIAEFIDNSTQSYYSNINNLRNSKYWKGLEIHITYEKDELGNYYLEIRDNAFGMDFNDFQRAIVLDSKPVNISRNEFGMGLKTAACWFGLNWSVETTQLGSNLKYKAEVDVDHLSKYRNEEIDVDEIDVRSDTHYTIVRIWNMNRTIAGRSLGKTKLMIAGMYRQDLRSGDISIYYNNEKLKYDEPEIYSEEINGVHKVWSKPISFTVEHNNKSYSAEGMIAIKKKAKVNEGGLTLFKNGRVIIGGYDNNYRPEEIFGKSNSFESQRIFGEIHMNDWPVVQTKDNFDWNNGLEDLFIDEIKTIADDFIKKSRKIRLRQQPNSAILSITSTIEGFENSGIIYDVKISDINPKNKINVYVEDNIELEGEGNHPEEQVYDDSEVNYYKPKSIDFKIDGREYTFNLQIETENEDEKWISIENIGNQYSIIWNMKHVFFRKFMDNPEFMQVMQNFIFAYAIAEVKTLSISEGSIGPSSLRNMINEILKKVGE